MFKRYTSYLTPKSVTIAFDELSCLIHHGQLQNISTMKTLLRNRLRVLSYLFRPTPYPLEYPIVIQFPVIDICNSACQMCNIWKNKKSKDISVEQLRTGLNNNRLYQHVTAIGINGGEPTLRKDLPELIEVAFECLPHLQLISLITNALVPRSVIEKIDAVAQVVKKNGGDIEVMVSLDGVNEVHDTVRGKQGNFNNAVTVINHLKQSSHIDNIRIGCTIIRSNVYGLHDLLNYCDANELYVKYRMGIPHKRLYTESLTAPYSLSFREIYHVTEFLEGLIAYYPDSWDQKFFYRSLIDQIVHHKPRKAGCNWQHRGATITASGELLYCAVASDVLGNIAEDDSEEIYFGNQAHIKHIIATKCDNCLHDYVGIPPKKDLAKQIIGQLTSRLPLARLFAKSRHIRTLIQWYKLQKFRKTAIQWRHVIKAPSTGSKQSPNEKCKRIFICGWYGTETLGDKAILAGIIVTLRAIHSPIEIVLISLHPYVSKITKIQMPELKDVTIVTMEEAFANLHTADLLLFGGGPLMGLSELGYIDVLFDLAKCNNIPTATAACGVGPIRTAFYRRSITRILNNTELRIYRDHQSKHIAQSIGINVKEDFVSEDPAFIWLNKSFATLKNPGNRQHIVKYSAPTLLLALRDYPWQQYGSHLTESENQIIQRKYEQAIIDTCRLLVFKLPNLRILLFPMCTNHFGGDDRWFYRRLFNQAEHLHSHLDYSFLNEELNPIDYVPAFLKSHASISMRFHSVVFSKALNLPTMAIDYTLGKGKVANLVQRHQIPCQNIQHLDSQSLALSIESMLSEPPKLEKLDLGFETLIQREIPKLLKLPN